ncbi:hypothetical protein [Streptomyces sp. NPDC056227]|uniref:hypothetical protein n=1 Tax=Streptomyces sp. NPDC056227 TaxID=3345753 RepID=UPI0035D85157
MTPTAAPCSNEACFDVRSRGRIGGRFGRADVAGFMLRRADGREWSHCRAALTH